MIIPATQIWMDASYKDRKMGAGWVTVLFNGRVQERSRPLTFPMATSRVAEYLTAIMALQMHGADKRIELFSDEVHVVNDINAARNCFVNSGRNQDLRNILKAVAASSDVVATYAPYREKRMRRAHDLATLGRLGQSIGLYHPVAAL